MPTALRWACESREDMLTQSREHGTRSLSPPSLRLPQIERLRCRRLKRERHFPSGSGRFVRGEDRFEDGAAVLSGDARRLAVLDAVDEVGHLLRKAVVPGLF